MTNVMQRRLLLMVMVVLVMADALTKIAAYRFLPLEQEITINSFCSLILVLNESGLAAPYQRHFGTGQELHVLICAVLLLMTACVVVIERRKWSFRVKIVAGLSIYVNLVACAWSTSALLRLPKLDPWTVNVLGHLG